ncbi:biotin-dependent carboxyltransferase family protein [Olivibacter sp. SDN3]|uniref:5-oxoprolinase subunit C family protein n=1 Tax=Olivibacter sp. SDN3 TaxID=2764720 RepID=UPI0016511B44|nr:biotin-dependent carboxyltransferase family protein [Olivibacter sp. SDN3]QNL49413.1 biotin-dependent carboxyltransferase family protein [Olivibacter sp. SDN3]
MKIRLIKSGMLTTIQDTGRFTHLSQGVPHSGAMDSLSARIANLAVGNTDREAVIEFTYAQASFQAETALLVAYAGDGALLKIGQQILPRERPLFIPSGAIISLKATPHGARTYLSIAGGWDIPDIMDSKSTYITASLGGFQGRALESGDILCNKELFTAVSRKILHNLSGDHLNFPHWKLSRQSFLLNKKNTVRIVPGREFTWFHGESVVDFLSKPYTLGLNSNRMGYRLKGPTLRRFVNKEILSTAVAPGTIQITGDGSTVLLMADCQTTGGYPRIAQVAAVDMPICGQLKPNDLIYFSEISRNDAEKLYIQREQQLQKVALALKYKFS